MCTSLLEKKAFRKTAILRRDAIPLEERRIQSAAIAKRLMDFLPYQTAGVLMAYLSFRSEAETAEIIAEAMAAKKSVVLPRCIPASFEILPVQFGPDPNCLQDGIYGLKEPDPSVYGVVDPTDIHLVLVPGVAFSPDGQRMGYGAGYYDRFLPRLSPGCLTIALAFEEQLYPQIPSEETDQALDYICTPKRLISCKSSKTTPPDPTKCLAQNQIPPSKGGALHENP